MNGFIKTLTLWAAFAAFASFSALTPTAASAQPADSIGGQALQTQIERLAMRLDRQEQKTSRWEKVMDNLPKITGYGIMGFDFAGDAHGHDTSFGISSVRLMFAGDIGRQFDYKFQFEFVSPKLIDAYLRWRVCPAFNIQAGQFRTGFSIEGYMVPLEMEAIDYAPIVKAVCTQYCDTRDIGIAAYGTAAQRNGYSIVEYIAGVYNGEGKNKADTNHAKDFIGRLKINPLESLTLSGSFAYGERGETYIRNIRWAAGAWWHGDAFFMRAEYLRLRQNDWAAAAANNVSGCYAVTGYRIGKFCPLARYNYMESRFGGNPSVRQSDCTVGLDYTPLKYLRVQANYTLTHYNGRGDANLVSVAVTGVF